jgi:hypothetical protein
VFLGFHVDRYRARGAVN